MARIGIIGGSYTSQSPNADDEAAINFYPEVIEGQGKSAVVLYPTPGTLGFFNAGADTPGRGDFTTQGRSFAVMGSQFYEIHSDGSGTKYGLALANDGTLVSWASSTTQVLIASSGFCYVFDMLANTLTPLPLSIFDGSQVSFVEYCDGFFLALRSNSDTFQYSNLLDAMTWDLLNVAQVSKFPDNVLSMMVDHDLLWFWGAKQSIIYADTGDPLFAFNPLAGAFIEQGIIAPKSRVRMDNSVFWIGGNERGDGIAWRANGFTPQRVSNHAVEFAWQGYSTMADAEGYSYQDQGHDFWVLYFPTANKTWVFDAATSTWHERAYWNATNGAFTAHHSRAHTFNFGKHLVADPFTGRINQMAISLYSDLDNPIRRVRRSAPVSSENQWIYHHQLQIDVETGLGPQPPLTQPSLFPAYLILADANGGIWSVTMNDIGVATIVAGSGTPSAVFLNDSSALQSYQVGVTTFGVFIATPVTFNPTYSFVYGISTTPSGLNSGLQIFNGLLAPVPASPQPRAPQMNLRWSDDGGHTWSNIHTSDAGQAGNYKVRAIWFRLGRSRDRVYEVSVTDPIPWRILEGYLEATPGFTKTERIPAQYRKVS